MEFDEIKELGLNQIDTCICLEYHERLYNANRLKVNIPKLMPLIKIEQPKESTYRLNKSILVNSENLPRVTSYITESNYMLLNQSRLGDINMEVNIGSKLNTVCLNNNIKDIKYAVL